MIWVEGILLVVVVERVMVFGLGILVFSVLLNYIWNCFIGLDLILFIFSVCVE